MVNSDTAFEIYIDNVQENISDFRTGKKKNHEQKVDALKKDIYSFVRISELSNYENIHNDVKLNNITSSHNDNFKEFENFEKFEKFVNFLFGSDTPNTNISRKKLLDYLYGKDKLVHKKISDAVKASDIEGNNQSLLHLIKFWPLIRKYPNIYLYIEQTTQLWSMIYKMPQKGTLSLIVSDNGEIRFSFIKQGEELSKFTGRTRISKNIRDYKHIQLLFEMMSLD